MTLVQDDPTWALEYAHFKGALPEAARTTDLSNDLWLHRALASVLGAEAEAVIRRAHERSP